MLKLTFICNDIYIYIYMHMNMRIYMYIYICKCMYPPPHMTCMYPPIYIYINIRIYIDPITEIDGGERERSD